MTRLWTFLSRLRALLRSRQLDRDLDDEIASHLAEAEEEYIQQGLSPEDAHWAALRSFGGVTQTKEIYRQVRSFMWLDDLRRDLRYALRTLRRSPGFTMVAVSTLAVGIGANATIFSVVNAVLLAPLPYADPARLVALKETRLLAGGTTGQRVNVPVSAGSFFDWRQQAPSLEQVAAVVTLDLTYAGGTEPEQIGAAAVSANFFPMLGVAPMLGRNFQPEEERPNAGSVVLLGHGFWQRRFAGDPSAIGQALTLDGRPFTIIGVMPPSFGGSGSAGLTRNAARELWLPLTLVEAGASRAANFFDVFARLKPGATLTTAQTQIDAVMQRLEKEFPETNAGRGGKVLSLTEAVYGDVQSTLWLLLGAVVLVLVIACSNVANLLFARATLRSAETAMRAALGASRSRLIRQFFTESLVLTCIGCAAGLMLAWASLQTFISILPPNVPRMDSVAIDGRVLAFTQLISLLTGMTFGLAPAWQGAQTDLNATLKAASRSNSGGIGRTRTRNALVVTQVALSLVLLMAAGLLLKSFIALRSVDPGFDPQNVLSLRVNLSRAEKYGNEQKRGAFYERTLAELKNLPGMESAAAVFPVPFSALISNQSFSVPGRPVNPAEQLSAQYNIVSPDYFHALRIRITQGRAFNERDRVGSPAVAIVNESLAQRMWPGENPLGKRLGLGRDQSEVVGVFADIKQRQLDTEPRLQICVPVLQQSSRSMFLAVRGRSAAATLLPAIRQRIAALDAELPLSDIALLEERVSGSIRRQRFAMLLLAIFAGTALALAVVGLYGVMSYLVAQRTREFGIRMALGAELRDMLKLIVGHGMKLVLAGLVLGVAGSLALTKVLGGMLFNVRATDPVTFVAVWTLLAAVGAIACYLPARRAAKVDPLVALRAE
jgi:putative ABC transport system permease protein